MASRLPRKEDESRAPRVSRSHATLEAEMSEHLPEEDVLEGETLDPDEQTVRERAWEISQRPDAGSAEENWRRAEEELRKEQGAG
jgi:hypothetical protein